MLQQGQVFPLTSRGGGQTRRAYRYRIGGRGSRRVQRGGFATEQAAVEALERALERLRLLGLAAGRQDHPEPGFAGEHSINGGLPHTASLRLTGFMLDEVERCSRLVDLHRSIRGRQREPPDQQG